MPEMCSKSGSLSGVGSRLKISSNLWLSDYLKNVFWLWAEYSLNYCAWRYPVVVCYINLLIIWDHKKSWNNFCWKWEITEIVIFFSFRRAREDGYNEQRHSICSMGLWVPIWRWIILYRRWLYVSHPTRGWEGNWMVVGTAKRSWRLCSSQLTWGKFLAMITMNY